MNVETLRLPALPVRAAGRTGSLRNDFQAWATDLPVAGLVSVFVGVLIAVILLPEDVEPHDALRLPAGLFILSLCLIPALTVFRDPKSLFRAEHVLLMAPAY